MINLDELMLSHNQYYLYLKYDIIITIYIFFMVGMSVFVLFHQVCIVEANSAKSQFRYKTVHFQRYCIHESLI